MPDDFGSRPATRGRALWGCVTLLAATVFASPGFGQVVAALSVHNFGGGTFPYGGPLVDHHDLGVIYGTTLQGGSYNAGEVYKVEGLPGSKLVRTTIYSFKADPDLGGPTGRLYQDASGALYGGCIAGGPILKHGHIINNGGIFKLTPPPNGHGEWTETILHTFPRPTKYEVNANVSGLIADKFGNLYGTVFLGRGSIFQIRPDGEYRDVHTFNGFPDGQGPTSPLTIGPDGVMYGVTEYGGTQSCGGYGCGGIYSLTPTGKNSMPTFAPVFGFDSGPGGHAPAGPVAIDKSGAIYGSNTSKKVFSAGVIFKVTPASGTQPAAETVVYRFPGAEQPFNGVVMDSAGGIYGTYSKGFTDLTYDFYLPPPAAGSYPTNALVDLIELHGGGFHTDGVTLTPVPGSGDLILDDVLVEGSKLDNLQGSVFRILVSPSAAP